MNMTQDERPMLEENQKDEVAITADGSKEATRQNQWFELDKSKMMLQAPRNHKSKSTRGDENKQVNSKAKSNQTYARTYYEEGQNSESKTKSTDTGHPYFTVVSCPSAYGKITYHHR
jgi:hypothetical protein